MNKKILSLILCLILALSVVFAVSCGGNDPVDTNSDTSTDTGSENSCIILDLWYNKQNGYIATTKIHQNNGVIIFR